MRFSPLAISGAFLIDFEPIEDERGFFCRTFCREEFLKSGLSSHLEQCSLSSNPKKGTLRGMHYQEVPFAEVKMVQCIRGAIYDVILDLRPPSKTFRKWIAVVLSESEKNMLYIPEGVAHGFQTLEDLSEVFYHVSVPHVKEASRGVRWDDPAFAIHWPLEVTKISDKDQKYEFFL